MNTYSDFAETYRNLPDGQLLKVAHDGDLVDEASLAIKQELQRRNLKVSDLSQYLESDQEKLQKEVKRRPFPLLRQTGFDLYGRTYRDKADRQKNIQTRTKFFYIGIPLIPIASYRFQCKEKPRKWFRDDSKDEVLNRVPLLWSQVFMEWVKAVLALLLMVAGIWLFLFIGKMLHLGR